MRANTSPVTPLPALTATATPQHAPLLFDVATRQLASLPGGDAFGALFPLVNDTILANDWSAKVWKVVRRDGSLVVLVGARRGP